MLKVVRTLSTSLIFAEHSLHEKPQKKQCLNGTEIDCTQSRCCQPGQQAHGFVGRGAPNRAQRSAVPRY